MAQGLNDALLEERRFGTTYVFELEKGLPDLPSFAGLVQLFADKWDGTMLPARQAFDIRDLRGWHERFALIEMDADMKDGTCRIMGNLFSTYFGGALAQGMRLSDARTERAAGLIDYFGRMLAMPAIGYFHGRLGYEGREHVNLEILDLPATNRDGEARYILSFAQEL